MELLQGNAPICQGPEACGRCEKCFAQMVMAYEGDGSDVVPVEHCSHGTRMCFTPDQLTFIAEYGFLPLTPASVVLLPGRLIKRGN